MSSVFPGAIDDFDTSMLPGGQMSAPSHAAQHQQIGDALEKIEAHVLDLNHGSAKIKSGGAAGTNTVTLVGAPGIMSVIGGGGLLIDAGTPESEFIRITAATPSGSNTAVTLAHNLQFSHSAGDLCYYEPPSGDATLIPCALIGMTPGATNGEAASNRAVWNRYMTSGGYLITAGSFGLLLDNLYYVDNVCDWESGLLVFGNGWLKGPGLKALNFTFSPLVVGQAGTAVLRGCRNGQPTRFNDGPQGYHCGGGFSISANNASDGNLICVVTNQPHYLENVYFRDAPGIALACGGSDGGRYQNLNFDNVGQCWNVNASKSIYFTDCVAATQAFSSGVFASWFSFVGAIGCSFRGLYPEVPYGGASAVLDYSGATNFTGDSFYTSGPQNAFTGSKAVFYSDATVPNPGPVGASYAVRGAWCGDPTVTQFWRDVARGITIGASDAAQGRTLMEFMATGRMAKWTTLDGELRKWINGSDYMLEGLLSSGSPNGVISAAGVGSKCTDIASGIPYYKTTAAGTATGWVAY